MNELITISVIKSSHDSGAIRKMIHAPTLKMYAVKVNNSGVGGLVGLVFSLS